MFLIAADECVHGGVGFASSTPVAWATRPGSPTVANPIISN
jgi:hypothetical protein